MKLTSNVPVRGLRWVVISLGLLATATGPAQAQDPASAPRIELGPQDTGRALGVQVGQSKVIKAPWNVPRVSVTDPEVAEVRPLTSDQLLLSGKAYGSTDLILWSERDQVLQVRIDVDDNLARMQTELSRLFPRSSLEVSRSRTVVIVTGMLARVEHADQLHRYLDASGFKYVDMTSVAGVQQVQIQVRVAEVSRNALRSLGVNAFHTGPHFFGASNVGSSSGGSVNPLSIGVPQGAPAGPNLPFEFLQPTNVSPLVSLFGGFPDADLQFFIQALAENQYLRVLAEPNLVALSGEEASFLAGGEFPIPVVQGGGAGTNTSISIEYREFGVRLQFQPLVLGDGTIRMRVAPEISDLSDIGAVEIQGFRVPSLTTRKAETTVEMDSGQTFALAGLLNQRNESRNSRIPLLGDIPVLGMLFRSVRYQSGETELVVLVTASLVEPLSMDQPPPLPGVTHVPPSDWQLYARGEMEDKSPPARAPGRMAALDELKALGLDRLRGPGAWASYDKGPAQSQSTLKPEPAEAPAGGEPGQPAPAGGTQGRSPTGGPPTVQSASGGQ